MVGGVVELMRVATSGCRCSAMAVNSVEVDWRHHGEQVWRMRKRMEGEKRKERKGDRRKGWRSEWYVGFESLHPFLIMVVVQECD